MDEFVVGFGSNPRELTPIDIVVEITGLTIEEVRNHSEVIELPEDKGTCPSCMRDKCKCPAFYER